MALVFGEKARRSSSGSKVQSGGRKRDQLALRVAQKCIWTVIFVVWLENNDLVAWIRNRKHRRDHALGGSAADRNFSLRIVIQPVGHFRYFAAMASRKGLAPQVMAY